MRLTNLVKKSLMLHSNRLVCAGSQFLLSGRNYYFSIELVIKEEFHFNNTSGVFVTSTWALCAPQGGSVSGGTRAATWEPECSLFDPGLSQTYCCP